MDRSELLERYAAGERDFSGAYLRRTDLGGANLAGAILHCAIMRYAYLSATDLSGANLSRADLSRADLRGADLRDADLRGADLRLTDLGGAILRGADLRDADLRYAYLSATDLSGVDLSGANLQDTCLDPANVPNGRADAFSRDPRNKNRVIGYRSLHSTIAEHEYKLNRTYTAPWFSTAPYIKCHPGLYLSPSVDAVLEFHAEVGWPCTSVIECSALAADAHTAGDKTRFHRFRTRRVVWTKEGEKSNDQS